MFVVGYPPKYLKGFTGWLGSGNIYCVSVSSAYRKWNRLQCIVYWMLVEDVCARCVFPSALQTHSLTQRRAVPGRSKHFNVLLAEHKGLAKEREALKEKEKEKDGAQRGKETCHQSVATQNAVCPSKSHSPSERPLSSLKLQLANSHIPR